VSGSSLSALFINHHLTAGGLDFTFCSSTDPIHLDIDRFGHLTVGENLNHDPLFHHPGSHQDFNGDQPGFFGQAFKLAEGYQGKLLFEEIGKPAFRQATLQWHLPTLEAGLDTGTGTRLKAFVPTAGSFAVAAPRTPATRFRCLVAPAWGDKFAKVNMLFLLYADEVGNLPQHTAYFRGIFSRHGLIHFGQPQAGQGRIDFLGAAYTTFNKRESYCLSHLTTFSFRWNNPGKSPVR
jgi:hypothetical protein